MHFLNDIEVVQKHIDGTQLKIALLYFEKMIYMYKKEDKLVYYTILDGTLLFLKNFEYLTSDDFLIPSIFYKFIRNESTDGVATKIYFMVSSPADISDTLLAAICEVNELKVSKDTPKRFKLNCKFAFIVPTEYMDELRERCSSVDVDFVQDSVAFEYDTTTYYFRSNRGSYDLYIDTPESIQHTRTIFTGRKSNFADIKFIAYHTHLFLTSDIDDINAQVDILQCLKEVVTLECSNKDVSIGVLLCLLPNKPVVVINGRGGSGKDTMIEGVARYCKVKNVSSVDKIKEIAKLCGWDGQKDDNSRAFLAGLKKVCADYNDLPLKELLNAYNEYMRDDNDILFVHIREASEIEKFYQSVNRNVFSVLVTRSSVNKYYGNAADDGVENFCYNLQFLNDGDIEERQEAFVYELLKMMSDNLNKGSMIQPYFDSY